MYACINCGSWQWRKNLFCSRCDITFTNLFQRKTPKYEHYYFLRWSSETKEIIMNLKNGNHRNWLCRHKTSLQYLLRDVVRTNQDCVYVAPSSNGKRGDSNHAYVLADSLGFTKIKDVFTRQKNRKQASLALEERNANRMVLSERPGSYDRLIIVDDVVTSGASVLAMIGLLQPQSTCVISLAYVEKQY